MFWGWDRGWWVWSSLWSLFRANSWRCGHWVSRQDLLLLLSKQSFHWTHVWFMTPTSLGSLLSVQPARKPATYHVVLMRSAAFRHIRAHAWYVLPTRVQKTSHASTSTTKLRGSDQIALCMFIYVAYSKTPVPMAGLMCLEAQRHKCWDPTLTYTLSSPCASQ